MEPTKDRSEMQIITAYQNIVDRLKIAGLSMKKPILDHECSQEFKQIIKEIMDSGKLNNLHPAIINITYANVLPSPILTVPIVTHGPDG